MEMVTEYTIDIGSLIVDKQTGENLDNGIIDHKEFLINAVQNGDIYICDIIENMENGNGNKI
jgi:hypothetical protein